MSRDALHKALHEVKNCLLAEVSLNRMILFGSRARGDFTASSDVDIIIVVDGPVTGETEDKISECVWQVGFDHGLVIVPVVFSRSEWEDGPMQHSLLAQAVSNDGITI